MTLVQSSKDSQNDSSSICILSLNCWGLKYLSKYRSERLSEIGNRLATFSPPLDIVGLQECWTFTDYLAIRSKTCSTLPYGKFYHSGIFGGGLAILSRWPVEDSSMYRYPLNGRPTAFFRGDWFVGKGVACATVRMPDKQLIEIFNTHLHAPYEKEPNDSYICHRTAQAWEISKLMKAAADRGSLVIGLGDFNMVPMSFAHALIESRGNGVRDVWRVLRPGSSIGASIDIPEQERRKRMNENSFPDVDESLREHGHTCDSVLNTWRWTETQRKALDKGITREISSKAPDPNAKRLDYIFFGGLEKGWRVEECNVVLTEKHPTLLCSLSDHFAVQTTIKKSDKVIAEQSSASIEIRKVLSNPENTAANADVVGLNQTDFEKAISPRSTSSKLDTDFYMDILAMVRRYTLRERKQRRYRLSHFIGSAFFSIGCFVAIWWSPTNYVSFILITFSSLGLMAGTVDGLIGGLFIGSELRALAEFEWEIRNALEHAGGPMQQEKALRDWYD